MKKELSNSSSSKKNFKFGISEKDSLTFMSSIICDGQDLYMLIRLNVDGVLDYRCPNNGRIQMLNLYSPIGLGSCQFCKHPFYGYNCNKNKQEFDEAKTLPKPFYCGSNTHAECEYEGKCINAFLDIQIQKIRLCLDMCQVQIQFAASSVIVQIFKNIFLYLQIISRNILPSILINQFDNCT